MIGESCQSYVTTQTLDATALSVRLDEGDFDFIDFGCGIGGSMSLATELFDGKKGLGLDISKNKIQNAKKSGYEAECIDILNLPLMPKYCRFVMISHFLEHLTSLKDSQVMLRNAIALARDFVYVQQPYFDADGMLFKDGYKLYWSDWHGHPNRMTSLEFHYILMRFLREKLITRFVIYADKKIKRASHSAIHPVSSPINQNVYDSQIHPLKKIRFRSFSYPVYHEIKVLIQIGKSDAIEQYASSVSSDVIIFDSHVN